MKHLTNRQVDNHTTHEVERYIEMKNMQWRCPTTHSNFNTSEYCVWAFCTWLQHNALNLNHIYEFSNFYEK